MSEITSAARGVTFIHEVALRYNSGDCLLWPYTAGSNGYGQVSVDGRRATASRYVCELVHGAPPTPKHEAAHECGNSLCVNPRHIAWKTHKENCADKLAHGTAQRGQKHPNSKIDDAAAIEIISLKGKKTQAEVAAMFGISQPQVSLIQNGKQWACAHENLAGSMQ